ncbi:hypothetical protein CBL_06146 [Carabus blaptoides fortunei]
MPTLIDNNGQMISKETVKKSTTVAPCAPLWQTGKSPVRRSGNISQLSCTDGVIGSLLIDAVKRKIAPKQHSHALTGLVHFVKATSQAMLLNLFTEMLVVFADTNECPGGGYDSLIRLGRRSIVNHWPTDNYIGPRRVFSRPVPAAEIENYLIRTRINILPVA